MSAASAGADARNVMRRFAASTCSMPATMAALNTDTNCTSFGTALTTSTPGVNQMAERLQCHVRVESGDSGHAFRRQVLHDLLGHAESGEHGLHHI
jgi:hypothetical protein